MSGELDDAETRVGANRAVDEWIAVFAARAAELAADLAEAELLAASLRMGGDSGLAATRRAKSYVLRHPRLKRLAFRVREFMP